MHSDFKRGFAAEEKFAREHLTNVTWATKIQDIHEHWDVMGELQGKLSKFDVKALRKVSRSDADYNDNITWIEGTNVNGNRGWIKGDADYIVFERSTEWLVIDRKELLDWVSYKLESNGYKKGKGLYQVYQRAGRKDKLTMIRYEDIPTGYIKLPKTSDA